MVTADESQVITILIILFASTVFGAKMAGLGTYKEAVHLYHVPERERENERNRNRKKE